MRPQIITLIMAISVSAILGACSTPTRRIASQDITFQTNNADVHPNNLRITLVKNPNETVPFYGSSPFGKVELPIESHIATVESYAAAKAVLGRIGLISKETTFSPHIVAKITKASCNQRFVSPICVASLELYWGTGEFIKTYKKAEKFWYAIRPSSEEVYNVYVKIFEDIVSQMLKDASLAKYFAQGFDDSLSSSTPNIPQLPYLQAKLKREAEEVQRKAQAKANLLDSEAILAKARSRGYASKDEIESILSLGPVSSVLNALILESLLPFPQEMNQALDQGNVQRVQSVSNQWRKSLKQIQAHVSKEAKGHVEKQLSQLDELDRKFDNPVLGELTIKLNRAIKEERWKDAKNIQELIRSMRPPEPKVAATPPSMQQSTSSQNQSNSVECQRAQQDYNQALAKYNAAERGRSSSRLAEAVGILGAFSPVAKDQALGALFSRGGRNGANDSQADMNHSLSLMQDAKGRMSVYCGK